MLLDPGLNQFWFAHGGGYAVVDCLHDSIVTEMEVPLGCGAADYDSASHRVYAASGYVLYVIDMGTRQLVDSLTVPQTEGGTRQVYCASRARKVYWRTQHQSEDSVFAVDIGADSLVARFALPHFSAAVCDDRTGDYIYFVGGRILVVDARADSVVSAVSLQLGAEFSARNNRTSRIYLAGLNDSVIQVVYDSVVFAGLHAASGSPTRAVSLRTVLSRSAPMCSPTEVRLYDATGRCVADFGSGPNDIRHLAPGVYFIREAQAQAQAQAVGGQRSAVTVRKIVIAK